MLDPVIWPVVWQSVDFYPTLGKPPIPRNGARVTVGKDGRLTYTCTCGATHIRARQELIPETQAWVKEHTPHLPPEEQV